MMRKMRPFLILPFLPAVLGSFLLNDALAGEWRFVEETDAITDERKQFIYGVPANFEGTPNSPYLRIGCYKSGTNMGVTMSWGSPVEPLYPDGKIDMAAVTIRFDKDDPLTLGWAASKTYDFTYAPNAAAGALAQVGESLMGAFLPGRGAINTTWNARELHHSLLGSGSAIFRASSLRGPDITLMFDMKGYIEEAAKFHSGCNPPGIQEVVRSPSPHTSPQTQRTDLFQKQWSDLSEYWSVFSGLNYPEDQYPISASTKIEALRVNWLDDVILIRATDTSWSKKGLSLYFLGGLDNGEMIMWLDGTARPIGRFLNNRQIKMEPKSVKEYLWMFSFFVRGEDGPFLIVEESSDTFFPKAAGDQNSTRKMEAVSNKLKPLDCTINKEKAKCDGVVYYGNNLFEATFSVANNGQVEMLEDRPIESGLPLKVNAPLK